MTACASCQSHTTEVMNFGDVALAGAFLREEDFRRERKYPLSLEFCESCYLLQVPKKIEQTELFEDYFYFSSAIGTLRTHFTAYASEVVRLFRPETVIEIGCNDGVLLRPLADLGVKNVIGVDPAKNVTDTIKDGRVTVINDYFRRGLVSQKADVVVANNVFAHIADINAVTDAIQDALKDDGVFVFEVNRLDSMVSDNQYDWVYHEHVYYYSLLSLEKLMARHGLMIFDLKRIGTHAGSIRYYACKKGRRNESFAVAAQRARDRWTRLDTVARFRDFSKGAEAHRDKLRGIVMDAVSAGHIVAGYGACGRANTMLQYCGFDASHIKFIVDDAPAKHGFYTPGSHIPIVPNAALKERPDMLIVFAWSFLPEIYKKCADFRGELIVPLPEIMKISEKVAA